MKINLSLLLELSKRDFLERYTGSIFGLWWSFIWPLVNILIYTLIFSKVMSAKIPGLPSTYSYGLYLASGIIPWMAFSNTISRSTNIFIEKKHVITKIPIQLPILPLSIVVSESITFAISLSILIFFLMVLGIKPSIYSLLIPFTYIFQQLLAFSLGLLFAILNVFIRDIKEIVNILLQIWFWFTPIVYTKDILPNSIKNLVEINPIYAFIQVYQKAFITKEEINFKVLILYSIISVIFSVLSYFLYKKLAKDIRDFL